MAPTIVLLQAGIQDTASPPPPPPPLSHAPYLAKGQQAPSPVGSLFATTSFTPASALYRADNNTPPTAGGHSPSLLLPEPPKLSFTIPEPASQAKPVATPGGGGGGDSAGPRTPTTPPPPPRGLRPTVSCQRYEPKEPTSAEGAPAPMALNGVM